VSTDSTDNTVGSTGSIQLTFECSGVPGNPVSIGIYGGTGNWAVNPSIVHFSDTVTTGTVTISGVAAGENTLSLQSSDNSRVKSVASFTVTTIGASGFMNCASHCCLTLFHIQMLGLSVL
jgi:hypothetical protein